MASFSFRSRGRNDSNDETNSVIPIPDESESVGASTPEFPTVSDLSLVTTPPVVKSTQRCHAKSLGSAELSKIAATCTRLLKEITSYEEQAVGEKEDVLRLEREAVAQKDQPDPMVDAYDVQKAREILSETLNLIPILISKVCLLFFFL